jgi:hypothetical protein
MMVAALFVATGGCYFDLPDVDPWDQARDARLYGGPHPVVAHPPCETWGAFARQGWTKRSLGDDDGCFASALESVRKWGGVLEHPACSSAWSAHGLISPRLEGGWVYAGDGGWTCTVEQGNYGHRGRKATWLYAYGCELPSLTWGEAKRDPVARVRTGIVQSMSKKQRAATPIPFRDLLLGIARSRYQTERRSA